MKRKSAVSVGLFALLLAFTFLAPSAQAVDPVFVFPFADGAEFEAYSDQPINLFWGWAAATKGQIQMFWNHTDHSYLMTDQYGTVLDIDFEEAEQYWTPAQQVNPEDWGLDCPMPHIYVAWWSYIQEPLPAGEYTLVFNGVRTNPVNDGYHLCSDANTGEPLSPPPSLFPPGNNLATTTLIVTDRP